MSINILYIGQFRTGPDGWTEGCCLLAKAIQTIPNVNLCLRNITMANKPTIEWPNDLQQFQKRLNNYDFIFQKVIPNLYNWDGRGTNIGFPVFETEFTHHNWLHRINLLDKVCVPSIQEVKWLSKEVKIPVFAINEPVDTEKCKKTYPPIELLQDKNIFKFLFLGEDSTRKNLDGLLQAYFSEFSYNDNVVLVVKTRQDITEKINRIRASLRKYINNSKYPLVYLITNNLPEEQILSLIQNCNIIVAPSYGEAFHRPSAMALCMGKPVIATEGTSICSYLNDKYGWIVDSIKEQVYCETPPIKNIYTCNEYWYIPSVLKFKKAMRESYKNKELYQHKCENIQKDNVIEQFSFKTIGQNILKVLT